MKNVVQDLTSAGIDWQREKWQSGLGSKFIHQGEKNAAKYADEVIVLSKGVQKYFMDILFAKDAELYELNGLFTFVIGGAYSVDKNYRLLHGLAWWPDEQPSDEIKR